MLNLMAMQISWPQPEGAPLVRHDLGQLVNKPTTEPVCNKTRRRVPLIDLLPLKTTTIITLSSLWSSSLHSLYTHPFWTGLIRHPCTDLLYPLCLRLLLLPLWL